MVTGHPLCTPSNPLFERINLDCIDHRTHGLVVCDEEQAEDKKLRQATRTGSFYMQFANLVDTTASMDTARVARAGVNGLQAALAVALQ